MKYKFVRSQERVYPVKTLCRVLGGSACQAGRHKPMRSFWYKSGPNISEVDKRMGAHAFSNPCEAKR
jgi:hypothetical protein